MSKTKQRLEYLRGQLRGECISWDEIAELQSLAEHIEADDVELREPAGLPEFPEAESPGCDATAETAHTHTPGPWREGNEYKGKRCIYGRSVDPFDGRPMLDHDTYICSVEKGRWIYEQAANAQLIAKAPETRAAAEALAEALRDALATYAPGADASAAAEGEACLHSSVRKARKALAQWEEAKK